MYITELKYKLLLHSICYYTPATESCPENSSLCYDIGDIADGRIKLSSLSRHDLQQYLKHHFVPGKNYEFSTCNVKKSSEKRTKCLSFQRSWLEQYKWLVYSPSQQGGYCKHCMRTVSS